MALYAEGEPTLYTAMFGTPRLNGFQIQQGKLPVGGLRGKVPPAFRPKGREAVRWLVSMGVTCSGNLQLLTTAFWGMKMML